MKYVVLASGSKGNSTLIQSGDTSVLIDCGSSKRYLMDSLKVLEMSIERLDGLVLTHSHTDHCSQLKHFKQVVTYSPFEVKDCCDYHPVSAYESFQIGQLTFYPIALSHDCDVTLGYIVFDGYEKFVYIADTGYIRDQDLLHLVDANYIVLESNYDPELLMRSHRPYLTKQRIMSDTGHLSNDQCGEILAQIITPNTKEIVLAHMSQEANNEEVALTTVRKYVNKVGYTGSLICAKQFGLFMGGQHD